MLDSQEALKVAEQQMLLSLAPVLQSVERQITADMCAEYDVMKLSVAQIQFLYKYLQKLGYKVHRTIGKSGYVPYDKLIIKI